MRGFLDALASLTLRGRVVAGAGAGLLAVGIVLGERSMVQAAVFVLALPPISALVVARERFSVASRRTVTPVRVPRGGEAEVLLELTNTDLRAGGSWLVTEELPAELGPPARFLVDGLDSGATARLRYRVHGSRRGRHALGPLRLRLADPFGLVLRSSAGTDTLPVVVVPRVRPLRGGGPSSGHGGSGEGTGRTLAVHGEDDVSTREYRHGDDLRKVHWRATARTGELMVRLEERPWRAAATILLDTRRGAHLLAPHGPAAPEPDDGGAPPDSLEWLIEAAASIGTSLARRGAALRAATDTGDLDPTGSRGGLAADTLLDLLAGVTPSRAVDLGPGIEQACRAAGDGPVICLLGAIGPEEAVELVRARPGPTADLAVLADLGSWADRGLSRARRSLAAGSREELDRQRDDAVDLLRAAGWQVAVARADQSVEEVWALLAGDRAPGPRPAGIRGVPA